MNSESKLLKYINGVVKSVFKGHPREEEGHVKNSKSTTNTQKRGSPKNGAKKAPRDRPGFNSILAQEITDTMSTMVKLDKEMLWPFFHETAKIGNKIILKRLIWGIISMPSSICEITE